MPAQPQPPAQPRAPLVTIQNALRARRARAQLARTDCSTFLEYVLRAEETGASIKLAPMHEEWQRLCDAHADTLIWAPVEHGKCEVAGSRILLANGEWRPIETLTEEVSVSILDPLTMTCREARGGPVEPNGVRPVVRLGLRSGRVLRVTEEHPVFLPTGWTPARSVKAGDYLAAARQTPVAAGIGDMDPVAAELLGYLVGDGSCTTKAIGWTQKDETLVERVRWVCHQMGWGLTGPCGSYGYRLGRPNRGKGSWANRPSPLQWVRNLGVACLSKHKRVPLRLQRSSDAAVAAFVGAYFACDGHVNGISTNGLEIASACRGLLLDTQLLLLRFGIASRVQQHRIKYKGKPHEAWRLLITGAENLSRFKASIPVHGIKRERLRSLQPSQKLATQADVVPGVWRSLYHRPIRWRDAKRHSFMFDSKGTHRTMVRRLLAEEPNEAVARLASDAVLWDEVLEVATEDPQPTFAFPIHDQAHCYLSSGVISHNSSLITIGRTLWELGQDPTLRFLILSGTDTQAVKLARPIMQYVESSQELHEVFPNLVPGTRPSDQWTQSAMTVQRPHIEKDPSVQVIGRRSTKILGARIDRVVIDDVLNLDNTGTKAQRDALWAWYFANVHSRLTARARVICVGTAFHPDDFMHRLAKQPGFVSRRYPAVDDEGNPRWPQGWSRERLERKKATTPPLEFARQILCLARDESSSRFLYSWFEKALERGAGRSLAYALKRVPNGCRVYTGVDLGVSLKDTADLTVLFTVLIHPNEDREVLNIESGRWTGPEIINRIVQTHQRYHSIVTVENNGAQEFLLQFARKVSAVPIRAFTTGRNKAHPEFGIEALATEFANGKWIIPNPGAGRAHPEIAAWINEMLFYVPGAHTGDRLMASWFARETARSAVASQGSAFRLDLLSR